MECRSKASRASVALIPQPLSTTWMSERPASFMMTVISEAPASTAFSTSSFTTEAGRCMTSPAAIWFATLSGRSLIMSFISLQLQIYDKKTKESVEIVLSLMCCMCRIG